MINELNKIIPKIPWLLKNKSFDTLLIDKYPPIIYRLSLKISNNRTLFLHKLFNTGNDLALMHSHSWKFACKVLQGEYEMGVGFSEDRNKPPQSVFTSYIKSGDCYEMLSSNMWHYTKPTKNTKYSYSVMLVGERTRERKAQNNSPILLSDKKDMILWFKNFNYKKISNGIDIL